MAAAASSSAYVSRSKPRFSPLASACADRRLLLLLSVALDNDNYESASDLIYAVLENDQERINAWGIITWNFTVIGSKIDVPNNSNQNLMNSTTQLKEPTAGLATDLTVVDVYVLIADVIRMIRFSRPMYRKMRRRELESREGMEVVLDQMLDPRNGVNSTLHLAAGMSDALTCTYIISHNEQLNVNAKLFGATPLHFALNSDNPNATVKLLLDNHADACIADSSGRTPLAIASYKGLDMCIEHLIKKGADPDQIDEDGRKPVEIAALAGYRNCVELLLPYTTPLSNYGNWSVDNLLEEVVGASFVEEMAEANNSRTLTNTPPSNPPEDPDKKGMIAFLFGNMDKLPTMFLSASLAIFAASHANKPGAENIIHLSETMFQILCALIVLNIHTSVLSFSFTAMYKEIEMVDRVGLKVLSCVVPLHHISFLLLVCLGLIGLERARNQYVISATVVVILIFIMVWPFPKDPPKSLIGWIISRVEKWRKKELRLPVTGS